MKPLEFKIEETTGVNQKDLYKMVFYYENGKSTYLLFQKNCIPLGLELNKHYSIADIYGYKVVDDREGL